MTVSAQLSLFSFTPEPARVSSEDTLSPAELSLLVELGLIEPTRRTESGAVTEYRLTHTGRTLTR
jgi:DNA-binding HxlR family transcriptional regulator